MRESRSDSSAAALFVGCTGAVMQVATSNALMVGLSHNDLERIDTGHVR
jgi:hypothetical protein